jgi:hypothetical protein
MIAETEDKIAAMQERFGHDDIYRYADKIAVLQKEFDQAKTHRDLLYRAWEYKSQ